MKKNYKPNDFINPYDELNKAKYKIIFIVCLIVSSVVFKLGYIFLGCAILLYTITEHFIVERKLKGLFIKILYAAVFLTIIITCLKFLGMTYGFLGILLGMVCLGAFIIFKRRKKFMLSLKHMETKIWGKPLDKKIWKKDELKDMKYKVKL